MKKFRVIFSTTLIGATGAFAFAADGPLVASPPWLSEVSAYQWRPSFAGWEAGKDSLLVKARAAELLFGNADPAQPLRRFLRDRAASRGVFGSLTSFSGQPDSAANVGVKPLMKIGSARQAREDLFGPRGALSLSGASKSVADLEIIVRGVNDDAPTFDGEAEQGGNSPTLSTDAPSPPLAPNGVRRVVDASEGTPLDPLRNTTYDLNYPKVVPSMKELSKYLSDDYSKRP